jgi:hypothetical protein
LYSPSWTYYPCYPAFPKEEFSRRKLQVAVTQRIYEANVLFAVAVNSAEDIQAPRAGGQLKALVSLVFSVISIEAFLNEAAGLALPYSKHAGEPQEVAVFAERMAEAEESQGGAAISRFCTDGGSQK